MDTPSPALRWNIEETRRLVHARWGPNQTWLMRPVLRAATVRMLHACYHRDEFVRIVDAHVETRLEAGTDIWAIGLPSTSEQAAANNVFFIQCEAHLFAAVQAIHATGDILAQVTYYALGLNLLPPSKKQRVSLHSMTERLRQMAVRDSSLGPIQHELSALQSSPQFLELSGLVNQLKHHGGPTVKMALEPSADQAFEMQFDEFLRDGDLRPAQATQQVLSTSFDRMNLAVVMTGRALNVWLGGTP